MRLAVHWADLHLADPEFAEACFTSPKTFAGEGSPAIDEFCVPEFATMLGRTNDTAGRFLTDCVEVAYRLPRLWAAVQNGLVAGWRARLIAQTTLALTLEAATYVDEQVFWCASRLTPSALGRLVDEARVRYMPDEVEQALERSADKRHVTFDTQQVSFDGTMALEASLELPDALALAEAVKSGAEHLAKLGSTDTIDGRRATALGDLARHQLTIGFDDPPLVEEGTGPVSKPAPATKPVTQVVLYAHLSADALTHPDATRGPRGRRGVVCPGRAGRPTAPVGGADPRVVRPPRRGRHGEPGDRPPRAARVPGLRAHREDPRARHRPRRTCVFPWCGRNARRCDLDHIVPYDHDHPDRGGPTSTDNLAALCRRHHRLKTHGRWRYEMTDPGVFTWTSPLGYTYLRDHTGSRATGRAWPEPGITHTRRTSSHHAPHPAKRHRRGHRHDRAHARHDRRARPPRRTDERDV